MKKQVSGVAGAARIKNVDRAGLARAEKHGKRLDKTGKARAISDVPPVTTTGLDLQALYEKHVKGAFVPKAKSSAMHLLIQFPTDLVDGADADYMLRHARGFAERVFGDKSIFADRVDRDEQSQRVVDLFLAPRYMKTTKHESKPATSTTYHLKLLADAHGEKPLPFGYGRALQTAFFEYMRDVMQLEGVERGKAKAVPGQDWKSAEQQRAEELDELTVQARAGREQAERDKAVARADREAAAATRAQVDSEVLKLERDRAALDSRDAELARRERQVQAADDALRTARAELQRQQDDLTIASAAAVQATAIARDEAVAAAKARTGAEAHRDAAARLVAQAEADSAAIEGERTRREAELALLMRASDDRHGLNLRPVDTGIMMDEDAMTEPERMTYRRQWPMPVRVLALTLAKALEQVRELARRFREREDRLKADEAAVKRQKQTNALELEQRRSAQRVEHEQALTALKVREDEVTASAADAERRVAAADTQMKTAVEKEKTAASAASMQEHWAKAVDMIGRYPSIILHNDDGNFQLDSRPERTGRLPDWLVTTLQQPAPAWAAAAIRRFHQFDIAIEQVEARERDAAHHLEQLRDMIDSVGPVLQPTQQKVVEQATELVRRVGPVLDRKDQGPGM